MAAGGPGGPISVRRRRGGAAGSPAVGRNLDGRLEVFIRAGDGRIFHRWQQAPGGPMVATWASMDGSFAADPVVGVDQNGRLEVFAVGTDAQIRHDWQLAPNDGWA